MCLCSGHNVVWLLSLYEHLVTVSPTFSPLALPSLFGFFSLLFLLIRFKDLRFKEYNPRQCGCTGADDLRSQAQLEMLQLGSKSNYIFSDTL